MSVKRTVHSFQVDTPTLPYRAVQSSFQAAYFEEETEFVLRNFRCIVPAEHYIVVYQGGATTLPKDEFEALFVPQEGPFVRCYQ